MHIVTHARTVLLASAAVLAAASAATAAFAHHSPAAYDVTKEVVIRGTIASVAWKNPHIYLTLDVPGADGTAARQEVEVGPISTTKPFGLTKEALAPGTAVSVRANPRRSGQGAVRGLAVTLADGSVYPLFLGEGTSAPRADVPPATSLAGRWLPDTAPFVAFARADWAFTDAGTAAIADAASQREFEASCEPWPTPAVTALAALRDIAVDGDTLTMRFDWMGSERVVHLGAEHPAGLEPSLQGHSVGRWEGETLVIDTVGFAPHRNGVRPGVPSSAAKHVVERLTLAADGRSLAYAFTVEDPDYLREPATFAATWFHRPDLEPSGEACDPDVARRPLEDR